MSNTTAPAPTVAPATPSLAHVDLPVGVHRLMALKGQFASLRTVRPLKVRKGRTEILKDSIFVCRIGVNYDNIGAVKEGRADGTLPAENAGLPWGEWLVFPYVIGHKGNHYFRCTSVNGNDSCIPKVRFLRNGVEISKEEAQVDALASEFSEKEDREVFTVKVESIIEINGEAV
jgi:hypothetical protein